MVERDFDEFAELLDSAYDLIGSGANKVISAGAKSMFFAAMATYSLETVRGALNAHCMDRVRGRFTPKPADLIEQIEASASNDGRPGAEEAWAIALTSRDEADTVVWTAECAEAFGLCQPVLSMGDEVGARMAFKEAYTRIVAQARAERRPAQWLTSAGWDVGRRTAAISKAVRAGLLPAPVVGLLAAPDDGPPDEKARAQLAAIKQMLAESEAKKAVEYQAALDKERADTAEFKARTAQQVADYINTFRRPA
jgi:hypothetical protein